MLVRSFSLFLATSLFLVCVAPVHAQTIAANKKSKFVQLFSSKKAKFDSLFGKGKEMGKSGTAATPIVGYSYGSASVKKFAKDLKTVEVIFEGKAQKITSLSLYFVPATTLTDILKQLEIKHSKAGEVNTSTYNEKDTITTPLTEIISGYDVSHSTTRSATEVLGSFISVWIKQK